MDLVALAQKYLREALELGYLRVSEITYPITDPIAKQILALSRQILEGKMNLGSDSLDKLDTSISFPTELELAVPEAQEETLKSIADARLAQSRVPFKELANDPISLYRQRQMVEEAERLFTSGLSR